MKKERIFYLDFIRAISIMFMLIFHFNEYCDYFNITGFNRILYYSKNGMMNGGVCLNGLASFFIITGTVLMYTYGEKINYKEYSIKRFKGTYPMFWVAYIFVFLYEFFTVKAIDSFPRYKLLLSLIGFDGYFAYLSPNFYKVGEWFLGALIIIYILFPICRLIIKKGKKSATITMITFAILTELVLIFYPFKIYYMRNMVICLFLTMLGMYFIEYIKEIKGYQAYIALVLYIIFENVNFNIQEQAIIYIPAILSFVIFVYFSKFIRSELIKDIFRKISKYSYPVLLIQTFVIKQVLGRFAGRSLSDLEAICLFLIVLILICILSRLLHKTTNYIIEMVGKYINLSKEKYKKKKIEKISREHAEIEGICTIESTSLKNEKNMLFENLIKKIMIYKNKSNLKKL